MVIQSKMSSTKSLIMVLVLVLVLVLVVAEARKVGGGGGFVGRKGAKFVRNGKSIYFNGFNAYWLMVMASEPSNRVKVTQTLDEASRLGMNVARCWAFNDGGSIPLQASPGSYSEPMFQGLDFVVSEAGKRGIYLILTLVNNWDAYGGKKQYVEWARQRGQSNLDNEDQFFINPLVKSFYKNHIKAVVTRINSFSGRAYKDDSTILAWELMNEPRSMSDLSGGAIQDWVAEMAAYVKSIDPKHMVDIGLEGFYGGSTPEKKQNINPGGVSVGTDFISNNRIPQVDFATIHLYPDQWLPGSSEAEFVGKWMQSHMEDAKAMLGKPLLVAEFGKSSRSGNYSVGSRDGYFEEIFGDVYKCAASGGACGGAMFWQLMAPGMDSWSDGYEVVFQNTPSTAALVSRQSTRISSIPKKPTNLVANHHIHINIHI